jgi:hypothetical protein
MFRLPNSNSGVAWRKIWNKLRPFLAQMAITCTLTSATLHLFSTPLVGLDVLVEMFVENSPVINVKRLSNGWGAKSFV